MSEIMIEINIKGNYDHVYSHKFNLYYIKTKAINQSILTTLLI